MNKRFFSEAVIVGTEWAARLALVNLIFLLFSIPIFTLLPSIVALFEIVRKWEKGDTKIPIFRTFLSCFRKNFWKSYLVGLPLTAVGIILFIDIQSLSGQTSAGFLVLRYAIYSLAILFALLVLYSFPIFVHYTLSIPRVYFLALTIGVTKPLVTLSLFLSIAVIIGALLFWPALFFFFPFSLIALLATKTAAHSLQKFHSDKPITSE